MVRFGYGLAGSVVLVTGASRGLGLATASRLAGEGCSLALCARDDEPLQGVARDLRLKYGVPVVAEAVDVSDHDRLGEFVQRIGDQLGDLGGVVANVGGGGGRGLADTSPKDWHDVFDTNVFSSMTALRAAQAQLQRTRGSAVLISSISGWKPAPGLAYGAAKAALIHVAACLAREMGPLGVRVNAVAPGSMLIAGRGWDRLRREAPDRYAAFEGEFPAGKLVEPGDVAAVIAFLLSDGARAINGALIPVDGGQNAPTASGY